MSFQKHMEYYYEFKEFADANGVSLECEDDWRPWYVCFLAGVQTGKEIERLEWQSTNDD